MKVYYAEVIPVLESLARSQVDFSAFLEVANWSFKTVAARRKGLRSFIFDVKSNGRQFLVDYSEKDAMCRYCAKDLKSGVAMGLIMKDALIKEMRSTYKIIIKGSDYQDTAEG